MFTGLIAELGTVLSLTEDSATCRLAVRAHKIIPGLKLGDSVAVNGVCLTVVVVTGSSFTADVMPETLRSSNLGQLKPGSPVNLERTLRPTDGLDGHLVAGHVEGVGTITGITREGNAEIFRITAAPELLRYIVPKGSIAVDGISLTVTTVTAGDFGVSLIPATRKATTLGKKGVGDGVNLETDLLAKYVERILSLKLDDRGAAGSGGTKGETPGLTADFLSKHGF